jgi:predicted O-linked N-acetylglucosamine transferase (SPINDLY family)
VTTLGGHVPGSAEARAEAIRLAGEAQRAAAARDFRHAAQCLDRAVTLDPANVEVLHLYVAFALQVRKPQAAAAAAARWVTLDPRSAPARTLHGVALRECGLLAEAVASLRAAVALDPTLFDAHVNLANALLEAGAATDAQLHYERALAIDPRAAAVHNNLGNLHRERREHALALAAYRRALSLDPNHARAHGNVGNVLRDVGRTSEAIPAYRRSLALAPDSADTWSNLLLAMDGADDVDEAAIADEHRAFGRRFAERIRPLAPQPARRHGAAAPLRVGLVSSDFCRHAAASFVEPLLRARDPAKVHFVCYYNRNRADDTTVRLQSLADAFVPVAGVGDEELAARIRADGIDVLIDLNGHTAGNRLPLFFLRPAAVQATWLGYLGATGVPTIDWRITDPHADPVDRADAAGLERAWRLPRTQWCWQPPPEAPGVAPLPCGQGHSFTFGCLNNPAKASPSALDAWANVLLRVPGSRLMLLVPGDEARVAELVARFATQGIDESRLEFVRRGTVHDYLAHYARVDVALDTFPYNGGATTCDALWMGAPVVTLASGRPFGGSGASILAQVGLGDLVARTVSEYVDAAASLAHDRERVAALRDSLRARVERSPLRDEAGFARDFENMLHAMASGTMPQDLR